MYTDRLGSVVNEAPASGNETRLRYLPYGTERARVPGSPVVGNDRDKFGTYYRDGETGLDYADQRFYASGSGRFLTSDPYQASGGAGDPGSWNRYGYVGGDPVNFNDPTGEYSCAVAYSIPLGDGTRNFAVRCESAYSRIGWFLATDNAFHDQKGTFTGAVTDEELLQRANQIAKRWEMGAFTQYTRLQARFAINGISNECKEKLEGLGIGIQALANETDHVDFFDAQQGYVQSMSLSEFGYPSGRTVAQYFAKERYTSAFTSVDFLGQPGHQVVLRDGTNAAPTTLVHEMLHVFKAMGDARLAAFLGMNDTNRAGPGRIRLSASQWISYQLDNKCTGFGSNR